MHVLLPPSETKRSGGGSIFLPEKLTHDALLRDTRIRVRNALIKLSGDEELAIKSLKLGAKNRSELLHNLQFETSGAMPAIERYTGVLFDALDAATLTGPSREWVESHVSVQSALFGLISAGDLIPAYRLSASNKLPMLDASLKSTWAAAHAAIEWSSFAWVLDMRSKDYAALAPLPTGAGVWLNVMQRGPDGEVRALNHFNKAAKGDLVRRLARDSPEFEQPGEFIAWAREQGLEVEVARDETQLMLITDLAAPTSSAGRG